MSLQATMEPGSENEQLQAQLAAADSAALAEKDRELAGLAADWPEPGTRGRPAGSPGGQGRSRR